MGKRNVLVVDDHPELRSQLRQYLEQIGFSTEEAPNARVALERLANAKPDLICLDLILPESSGYELCEFIRKDERLRNVPVLALSERALPSDRAYAAEAGADAFLPKPFTREQLEERVRAIVTEGERS